MLNKLDNPLDRCELKFDSGSGWGVFEAIAASFGNNDSYDDTIVKGAFSETIKNRPRPLQIRLNHAPIVIGKATELREDDVGLRVRGELTPGHSIAKDVHASMKHGALDGVSIGFRIPPNGSEEKENGGRVLTNIDLREISIVSDPADDHARVTENVKTEIESINSLMDAETMLREVALFSKSEAVFLVSRLKELCWRDADSELRDEIKALTQQGQVRSMLDKYSLRNLLKEHNDGP